ncbi:MAG: hypothetical protein A3A96_00905 [Candidatus Zambryskibacteria bacterium RIFCSPLOWO2_01_FULL_39_39]|uniref:Addiction module toxin RelE n=1 Tax=Candidatus Zambryskibacteria bacterium RIFCSPLOWO2_01_FULL_39_39 TaxID=1802758 RepID=A0A1G2TYR5_9BACT|nr:MAG: hypothetical protein UT00_C0001G0116 [Parcubacteria group bacterium GW2011_GWA1_38_7]OHA87570.1 MAG: hypothetical protein A2644_04485 [Candidatus Zambryskibacteria bacterium RIFCSPHIGHO2_01_FULL_39_63]OHA95097.1 MAG: hypothetical protein A3B88_03385 [Candidatus Zambryskibacteria bacterium RIFCSPHIGHO2_02_FULL_39_19]OHA98217.1 MAG: hypothetical protein A3F20_04200 [Candidatus Zambryskibacteria bacterium RIFCSPHIGHO2_12_FULL_39_21]OHB02417.1 MAG: hypothetical protein A3A96_00905 [Candidat
MNKLDKFLSKLSSKERSVALEYLNAIKSRNFENLNFKKLKGFDDLYRVRKSNLRIIFRMSEKEIDIIKIDRRNDNTYENL